MGRRGPAKASKGVLEARGSRVAKKRKPDPLPPCPEELPCPKWLTGMAREVWGRLVPMLHRAGIIREADRHVLERYCVAYAQWRGILEWLDVSGTQIVSRDPTSGVVVKIEEFPQVRRAERLADQMLRMERHLGLTPAARADLVGDQISPHENRGGARPGQTGRPKDKTRFFRMVGGGG